MGRASCRRSTWRGQGASSSSTPDTDRFPCLALAFRALRGPEGLSIVLNAANEVAVSAFLDERLGFTGIPDVIRLAMDAYERNGAAARHRPGRCPGDRPMGA